MSDTTRLHSLMELVQSQKHISDPSVSKGMIGNDGTLWLEVLEQNGDSRIEAIPGFCASSQPPLTIETSTE